MFRVVRSTLRVRKPLCTFSNIDFKKHQSNRLFSTGDSPQSDPMPSEMGYSRVDIANAAVEAPMVDPTMSDMGYTPVDLAIYAVDALHNTAGLPWWASIGVMTFGFRLALFPLNVYTMRNTMRLSKMTPDMTKLSEEMKKRSTNSPQDQMVFASKYKALQKKHGVKMSHAFLGPVAQIPIFITMLWSLRSMAETYPSFSEGGALWFKNLSEVDTTYGLPIMCSASFLIMFEVGSRMNETQTSSNPDQQKMMKNVMRAMSILMIPVTLTQPSAITLYWTFSNAMGLTQTAVLAIPGVKPALGVYIKKTEPEPVQENVKVYDHNPRHSTKKIMQQNRDASS